jgi:hypothetical protein
MHSCGAENWLDRPCIKQTTNKECNNVMDDCLNLW